MARKWQILYNAGQGWRPYSNKTDNKAEIKRRLKAAREGSARLGDGWEYKVFLIEETPAE